MFTLHCQGKQAKKLVYLEAHLKARNKSHSFRADIQYFFYFYLPKLKGHLLS